MKSDIHPTWNPQATVTCACGNTFQTGSTQGDIQVDICSQCHPFFTGEMKFIDRQGRVDRFRQKMQAAKTSQRGGKKSRQTKKQQQNDDQQNLQTFKQVLHDERKSL